MNDALREAQSPKVKAQKKFQWSGRKDPNLLAHSQALELRAWMYF
jgi:hypothetical protein